MMKTTFLAITAFCLALAACSSDSEDLLEPNQPPPGAPGSCDTAVVTFASTITPLLTSYGCTGCHGGPAPANNINLTSYNGVKAKINDGRLFGAINHQSGFSPMPQGGNKMSACDINKFRAWINRGALNN